MLDFLHKRLNASGLIEVIRYLFILLFLYAAISKLLDFETFQVQLAQSPLFSAYAGVIAVLVPGIEIVIAIFLMLSRFRKLAFYASFTLMVMFTAYIYIILNFSDFIPCSCGGVLEKMSWTQHLIFNVGFIVLAVIAIYLTKHWKTKKKLLVLLSLLVMGIGIVTLLFVFSEKKIHRNNAFQRRYLPHVLEKVGVYDLKSNSHYISGISDDSIYLGDYGAPLYLKAIDTKLTSSREFKVFLSNTGLPYRRVLIRVKPPHFYLGDGSVPVLFRGYLTNWEATPISYSQAFFTQYRVVDSTLFGLVTTSSITESNALGLLNTRKESDELKLNTIALRGNEGAKFGTDGYLLWNVKHQKFIYLYYYKNSYEIFDHELNYEVKGKTIDTISKPILDIAHYSRKDEYKLGGKSVFVNRQSATSDDFLYVHSDRLGQYENDQILNTASIIDIYDITDSSYSFSFYLFHQRNKKLKELEVYKDLLIAIVDTQLWLYKLKPAYFNTGPNATNTAQYQE